MKVEDTTVAIIDYGMCNLFSVRHACEHVGLLSVITSEKQKILNADAIILPGVGAFGEAMSNLKRLDLIGPIKDAVSMGKTFMGICLGMQLLMTESEEFGSYRGLNIIHGTVMKFSKSAANKKIKVPQIGWNQIFMDEYGDRWEQSPLKDTWNGEFMYFVHSYYPVPQSHDVVLSKTDYEGVKYCSSLVWGNVSAFQFHPEKSGREGIKIYQNWASMITMRDRGL